VKRNTIIIILFSVLTALLIAYFFLGTSDRKRFSWRETYMSDSDQPYGTMFIRQLLETYRPGEKFIHNDKTSLDDLLNSDSVDSPADYIFIGTSLALTDTDAETLLDFIASGNNAFIATTYLPYQLTDSIFFPECENELYLDERESPSATLNFYHQDLKIDNGYTYVYRLGDRARPYRWTAVQQGVFCDSTRSIVALGHSGKDVVNFFKIPFGKGNLYVHTNPLAFTNYFMRVPDKAEYAAKVFSHLRGKTIIWDEYSRSQFSPSENESNPLSLIVQHDSLKYAWWMLLVSVILYIIFTAKRKQRIVPVREEKVNTSLEYVKLVAALHFENGNNHDIALKKMKYFLYFIRAKYGIQSSQITHDHFKRLSEKSQIDLVHIETIFSQYGKIEKNPYRSADEHELISFYNAIDRFYKHCK
jgi:hypothetical protein